jgi:DNA polymerase-3 subunit beta
LPRPDEITVAPTTDLAFTADRHTFSGMLSTVAPALPSSTPFPILRNVRLHAERDRVVATASNLELTMVATGHVEVTRTGEGLFPGRRLLDIASALEDDAVQLDARGGRAVVSSDRTTWEMPLPLSSGYPDVPEADDGIMIEREPFVHAIGLVRPAVSKDTTRPSMRMIDVTNAIMRATDGVRYVEVAAAGLPDLHIPAASVDPLVAALTATAASHLEVVQSSEHVAYRLGDVTVITRKLVERFPAIDEQLLAPAFANNDRVLTVDRADLLGAIRRVRLAADPHDRAIVMKLSPRAVEVRARDRAGNAAREGLSASWDGEDRRQVAFHHQVLADTLRSAGSGEITMRFGKDKRHRRSPMLMVDGSLAAVVVQLRAE